MLEKFYISCGRENHWALTDTTRAKRIIYLKDEYEKFWQKIKRHENFALPRYGDGERALMVGREVKAQEGWSASGEGVTPLGKALNESIKIDAPNFYYGVSCPCCDSAAYYWYLQNVTSSNITFANIWLNANFKAFKKDFQNLKRDAVLITNWRGEGKKYGKLNIKKHYTVSDDCVKFYEEECTDLINQIIADFGQEKNLLYVISAGPLSCVIIAALFKNNPDNCYVDFGSATDLMTHEKVTRPYMVDGTAYAKQSCWMFDRKKISTDVDVVLTCYKRPQVLRQQLEAIKNQTLAPKRIFLYQDGIDGYYKIDLNEKILDEFDAYKIAETNGGVWKRFEFANEIAESPYVCLFDDDTIPGERWLENCHMNMMQNRGVYGTNGVLMLKPEEYPRRFLKAGWHKPNAKTCAVDLVGHSWFFEKKYLDWMLAKPWHDKYKLVAEDMTLSVAAAEHGFDTYVPQHSANILSLWGSIPDFGWKYGRDEAAISISPANLQAMQEAVKEIRSSGWKCLLEKNPVYRNEFLSILGQDTLPTEKKQAPDDKAAVKLQILRNAAMKLLPFFGRRPPIFLGEGKFAPFIKKIFALQDTEYHILEDENLNIDANRLVGMLRQGAVHVFVTSVYDKLKPFLEQLGLHEGVDFIDGRELLAVVLD